MKCIERHPATLDQCSKLKQLGANKGPPWTVRGTTLPKLLTSQSEWTQLVAIAIYRTIQSVLSTLTMKTARLKLLQTTPARSRLLTEQTLRALPKEAEELIRSKNPRLRTTNRTLELSHLKNSLPKRMWNASKSTPSSWDNTRFQISFSTLSKKTTRAPYARSLRRRKLWRSNKMLRMSQRSRADKRAKQVRSSQIRTSLKERLCRANSISWKTIMTSSPFASSRSALRLRVTTQLVKSRWTKYLCTRMTRTSEKSS
jgi:hypothetical protein